MSQKFFQKGGERMRVKRNWEEGPPRCGFCGRELAAEELAKATRSEVVQVIGTKFVLYRESHSKPKEKRIQLVKPSKKKANP